MGRWMIVIVDGFVKLNSSGDIIELLRSVARHYNYMIPSLTSQLLIISSFPLKSAID